jgi:hypothetical protein
MTWHVYRNTPSDHVVAYGNGSGSIQSANQYKNISFVFSLIIVWLFALLSDKKPKAKLVFGGLFYGLFFWHHIKGNTSWRELDDLRYAQKNSLFRFVESLPFSLV